MTRQAANTERSPDIEVRAEGRPQRVPVSGDSRNVLTISGQDPNYVYRWVNDVDNGFRVKRFLDAGYELVAAPGIVIGDGHDPRNPNSLGTTASVHAGNGTMAYAMRQRKEFYVEDQAVKQASVDETERALGKNVEGSYGKITIT